ncbi:predicted protein [Streptomyces viridosporus ATCC 14672]|uniref:Predicted protein n=1 Tax=Streptomyces viridosporus (strain ATCC 14672 / DSM 40746 / JCM 4963 / KCTC 9882 / NRRL B-12104 / FH 1290) TaxID=566461 RepID=D6A349_STRV1|nr:predicted protein [Streptomyces viridosporus ATCC 14672]
MDERKDPPAPAERRPAVAAGIRLPPAQEAYDRYTLHATRCWACRDVDRSCLTGTELHRAWRELAENALDRLAGEAPPHGQ